MTDETLITELREAINRAENMVPFMRLDMLDLLESAKSEIETLRDTMNDITYIITISSKRSSDRNMYRMISDTPLTRSWIIDRMYDHKYNPDLDMISIELLTDIPEIC